MAEYTEEISLKEYTEKAYLNYSMYVILDRALPHIGDGLKPVQRRIIYAMSELGLKATSKHKKSARTVGDVLGKFHPHGDSACYEAMVLMAQPFSYRYPLVDGQGNWGSQDDPKSFAAMRYTEARMSGFSELLLSELGQGTVDWQPNFDGTLKEPTLLPARLPNVLLNGAMGIAVGMSTDIPSHNLREIANACIYLLENPKATLEDIAPFIQGPDLPTEAEIITPRRELLELYATGKGTFRMRAVYTEEDGDIIITGLPHQVSGAKIMEQIAQQMQNKKLPMIADLRDESDHENPTRLVIVPRSNRVEIEPLMLHLFSSTDMEKTYRVNMNIIGTDGRPQVKSLLVLLNEWLVFRTETVRRRFQFRLDEVNERLHILEGYLAAYLNIDEVIHIVRTEDDPKFALIQRFTLTDIQADAILSIRLRQLAKLEEIKIRDEQKALTQERDEIVQLLGSSTRLKKTIIREIKADAERFGDHRRSPVIERAEAKILPENSLVAAEPMTVILSQKGWVRAAKGHDIDPTSLSYKAGDEYLSVAYGRSNESAIFLDSNGRSYSLPVHGLPSARGQGEPLTGRLNPESGATFQNVFMGVDSQSVLLSSDFGYGFVVKLGELITKNKAGKAVLTVPEGAHVLPAVMIASVETDRVVAITNEGRMLIFPISELPELNKGKGNKIIAIPTDRARARQEFMAYIAVLGVGEQLRIIAGKRKLELGKKDLDHYVMSRGKRGSKLPKGFHAVTHLEVLK